MVNMHAYREEEDIDFYKYGISTNIHRRIREHKVAVIKDVKGLPLQDSRK